MKMFSLIFCFLLSCPLIYANSYKTLIHSLSRVVDQRNYFICTEEPTVESGGLALTVLPWNGREIADYAKNNKTRRIPVSAANANRQATLYVAKPIMGDIRFDFDGDYLVGRSKCRKTFNMTVIKGFLRSGLLQSSRYWWKIIGDTTVPSYINIPGVYYICGDLAYRWLPRKARGTCYLGSVLPEFSIQKTIANDSRIVKRALYDRKNPMSVQISTWERIIGAMMPSVAIQDLYNIVIGLSSTLETITNKSVEIDTYVNRELIALRCMVSQNRYVLDFVVAERGGVCRMVKGKCCTYIPDYAANISLNIEDIRNANKELNGLSTSKTAGLWGFTFFAGTLGWMGAQILKWFILALCILAVVSIVLCIGRLIFRKLCCKPVEKVEARVITRGEIEAEAIEMLKEDGDDRLKPSFDDRRCVMSLTAKTKEGWSVVA